MVHGLIKIYLKAKLKQLAAFSANPHLAQAQVLKKILLQNKDTPYLRQYIKNNKKPHEAFKRELPMVKYEEIHQLIETAMLGQKNQLLSKHTNWFSKSSGTTNGQSKYIPVTKSFLYKNHINASWYAAALVYQNNPAANIFARKNLLMGGTIKPYAQNPKTLVGDISGFTVSNIPSVGRPFYTPDFETALLEDWDAKIKIMVEQCSKESVYLLAGVPTWTIVLFNQMLEHLDKKHMLEIWPDASAYLHGGINFEPYKAQFQDYFPKEDFHYMEVYNASEGCFAIQDNPQEDGMLLLLDSEIYFEFVRQEDIHQSDPQMHSLDQVQIGQQYAIIITTTSGLYRYQIGDLIRFTSLKPYRIKVTGRIKEYINAFGEELIIENATTALQRCCSEFNSNIIDFSVAPIYLDSNTQGCHQWLIEFVDIPTNLTAFAECLDAQLQALNSDYAAKRSGNLALSNLKIEALPSGTFEKWMRSKGRFGNQFKVPKLKNDRSIVEEILAII